MGLAAGCLWHVFRRHVLAPAPRTHAQCFSDLHSSCLKLPPAVPTLLPCLQAARAPVVTHRKVRFVHVKINRAHCRATYEGYPL